MFRLAAAAATVAACSASSVPPAVQWVNGYDNGDGCEAHPHKVVETSDGGFFMVGDSMCWDGSATAKRMIFVVKTDASGNEQWSSRHGTVDFNYGKGGVELSDGTFLVVGALSAESISENKKGYVQHRALIHLGADGTTLRTTILPNEGAKHGLLDGVMCAENDASEENTVVVTGYKGSVEEYEDNPMFLIFGGSAYVMKLRFGDGSADPEIVYDKPLGGDSWDAVQGMRIGVDATNNRYVVASLAVDHDSTDVPQMSMFSIEPSTGEAVWARFLPAENELEHGVMSHPYAMAIADDASGYAVAGHAFPCWEETTCQPLGRLAKVSPSGDLLWDHRFRQDGKDYNTECYGTSPISGGGFVVACGTGVEPEDHPLDSQQDKTWRALVHEVDGSGTTSWQKTYTSNEELQNNAAEDIFTTQDGGYAIAIDSQSYGKQGTGGNFGLMRLVPEESMSVEVSV